MLQMYRSRKIHLVKNWWCGHQGAGHGPHPFGWMMTLVGELLITIVFFWFILLILCFRISCWDYQDLMLSLSSILWLSFGKLYLKYSRDNYFLMKDLIRFFSKSWSGFYFSPRCGFLRFPSSSSICCVILFDCLHQLASNSL